ncbi:MAG TPA: hypothetical protein VHZ81_04355 [Galbitalea sp.]|nr:hypothetical protein [Galbitalea sp.]
MATNNGGFWASRFGRWLESGKNSVGCVLAVGAIVLEVTIGLGPLWPLIVVAAYVVGALVWPRDRLNLTLAIGETASADDLKAQLATLRKTVSTQSGRLGADVVGSVAALLDILDEVVSKWDDLLVAPEQSHVVQQMIVDYLPTSLQTYLNIPATYAMSARVAGKKSAHDELLDQLGLLTTEAGKIRAAVYSKDLDALGDQSRFLQQKFATSSLDLPDSSAPSDPSGPTDATGPQSSTTA